MVLIVEDCTYRINRGYDICGGNYSDEDQGADMTDFLTVGFTALASACAPFLVERIFRRLLPKNPQIAIVTPTGEKIMIHRSDLTFEKVQEIIHSHS